MKIKYLNVMFAFLLAISMISCETTKIQNDEKYEESKYERHLYLMPENEAGRLVGNSKALAMIENGVNDLSYDEFCKVYENHVANSYISSMIFERFLTSTRNENVKNYAKQYLSNKQTLTKFDKVVLCNANSKEKNVGTKDEKSKIFVNGNQYAEDINLFSVVECHPFDDEFGCLLFDNNWYSYTINGSENKNLYLMCGGETNTITLHFEEFDGIKNEQQIDEILLNKFYSSKYKNWKNYELPLDGIVKSSGADRYFIAYGDGTEETSRIKSCASAAYLYNERNRKIYKMEIYYNISSINMNYEIRESIYDYLNFFTQLCFCN